MAQHGSRPSVAAAAGEGRPSVGPPAAGDHELCQVIWADCLFEVLKVTLLIREKSHEVGTNMVARSHVTTNVAVFTTPHQPQTMAPPPLSEVLCECRQCVKKLTSCEVQSEKHYEMQRMMGDVAGCLGDCSAVAGSLVYGSKSAGDSIQQVTHRPSTLLYTTTHGCMHCDCPPPTVPDEGHSTAGSTQ